MPLSDEEAHELAALREEVRQLRAENTRLQPGGNTVPARKRDTSKSLEPVRILLTPDPAVPSKPGSLGAGALADVASILLAALRSRQPDARWRAEHDLGQIPEHASCFQLGQVARRMFDGSGAPPMTFAVQIEEGGRRSLRRRLIPGEPDSDRFSAAYERKLGTVDELLAEGDAAYHAGAHHHAQWSLKAADVTLAQLKLAFAQFEAGTDEWARPLTAPRLEYEPRYRVGPEMPAGL